MKLARLFSDHAIVQRDIPIPVWGWTQPLSSVRVTLGPVEAVGVAGDDGKFTVRLPPLPAGGPHRLEARDTATGLTATANDIMVGEVWVASGQSNMEWLLSSTGAHGLETIRNAHDPLLRVFRLPRIAYVGGQRDPDAAWKPTTPGNALAFSAVAYHFATRLRAELNVPVGFIDNSWGGTMIEAWIGRSWLVRNRYTAPVVARYEADVHDPGLAARVTSEQGYPVDPGNVGFAAGWADADRSDDWRDCPLPRTWQQLGHNHSGVFWFRKQVEVPATWAGKALLLRLGAVDKQDISYFNGRQVGAMGSGLDVSHWNRAREYVVPGELVRAGVNTIAVRAYSFVHAGGMIGPADLMELLPQDGSGEPIALAGDWQYRIEHDLGMVTPIAPPQGQNNPNTPAILHDTLVTPIQPYAIRGAIWYQGESNAARANEYHSLMLDLIRSWRHEWGQGDFPFLFVQLANYRGPLAYEPTSTWAPLREAQLRTLDEPDTGMAVAIDIGDAYDIHPINKLDVGQRLAHWALARTYHRPVVASGPLYQGITIEGSAIRVRFHFADGGLVSTNGPLRTFAIAGADRKFKPAEVTIDGDTVVVRSPEVIAPVAVRYAWADNPEGCNLANGAGLPASPFRSDAWT